MSKKLKILVVPTELAGHVNAGIGLSITLRTRGHHIQYLMNSSHKNIVSGLGFDVITMDYNSDEDEQDDFESRYYRMLGWFYKKDIWSTIKYISAFKDNLSDIYLMMTRFVTKDRTLERIIEHGDHDLIILDDLFCYPSIIKSQKPWVFFYSPNPVWFYQDHNLNFPSFPESSLNERPWFRQLLWSYFTLSFKVFNWFRFILRGHWNERQTWVMPYSPYLNLYCIPSIMDTKTKSLKFKNSYRLDYFIRADMLRTELPPDLKKFIDESEGRKLIYLSFGTVCCEELDILKKLLAILSKTEYRVIVSKGGKHSELTLAANMWGDKYLPQKAILPLVDLFITHAGYNSVVESLCAGKPMIMLPLWMDTLDNANRIQELGLGVKLDANNFTETQLIRAIDALIHNSRLSQTLSDVSKRLHSEDRLEVAARLVENVIHLVND